MRDSSSSSSLERNTKKSKKDNWKRANNLPSTKPLTLQERALRYYDPTKEIILQADASRTGFGPTLLQDQKPIVFANKTLTDAESRYANIQREPLAVVYRCKRFLTYLFGRSSVAKSDHKPLESIQMKNLVSAPPRLQRMLLRLQPGN